MIAAQTIVFDARVQSTRKRLSWIRARKVEQEYGTRLSQIARQIGEIIRGFAPYGTLEEFIRLRDALSKYGEIVRPWAAKVAQRMVQEIGRKDASAWEENSRLMGRSLAKEIQKAPTGERMQQLMDEQVGLITSLPRHAAERVHKLTIEGISNSTRAEALMKDIFETGRVTKSRAMLIARTETARTASVLTQARAEYVDSPGYFWRTAKDADVRPLHRQLEGKFILWTDPPAAGESGEKAHAGQIYNCRCVPEPVLPDLV